MRDIDFDQDGLGSRLGGLLRLRHRHGGTDNFLLLTTQLGGDGGAAALLFGGGHGGGLTLGIPGAEAVAHLGNPRRQRGLRVVGERAEETEAIREDEDPGTVVAQDRMEHRGVEHVAEHAARTARIEGDRDILSRAEPEGKDRREEDHAHGHQGDLDWPERVGALIEREPCGREKEERDEEAGVAEEAEEDDCDGRAKGPTRIVLGLGVRFGWKAERLLQPLGDEVLVGRRVEEHRDEQERADEGEHDGENRFTLAGRAGERGRAFTGRSGHDYSPKRVPCEAASAAPGGDGSECR